MNNHMGAGTIHNKLQGTVYDLDFDEDLKCGDNVENLKSMRERRRSIDYRHQNESYRSRDASESPKFAATANSQKIGKSNDAQQPTRTKTQTDGRICVRLGEKLVPPWRTDVRDLRPPSPHADANAVIPIQNTPATVAAAAAAAAAATASAQPPMHTIEPVMPGPVDMRTYNSGFDASNNDVFNSSNLLGAFASGLPEQTLPDIDEEFEKDFQSALKASNSKASTTNAGRDDPNASELEAIRPNVNEMRFTSHVVEPPMMDPMSLDHQLEGSEPPKHSLIKLKIKGPHARPENYTSSVITTYQTHNNTTIEQTIQGTPNSSIRRMRKKELLRQYWTQENMDDSNCAPQQEQAQHSTSTTTNSGRSAGIPKAVDSMSSIPTKDDYKDYTALDIKKRKVPANRELRQLDVPSYSEEIPERRRSVCSNASNTSSSNAGESSKRKTRTKQAVMTTPKLKIKLGPDVFEPSGIGDSSGSARPPKKRLSNITIPTYEELRRESMNYRKQVISQFNDTAKPKKNKDKSKREKGKHKKNKKEKDKDKEKKPEVQIVSNDNTNPSKLIIRFAKRKAETSVTESGDEVTASGSNPTESSAIVNAPAAPIKLKLARSSQGGGYVMATEPTASTSNPTPKANAPKDNTDLARCQVVLTDFTKLSEAEKYACNLPLPSQQSNDQSVNGNLL